LFFMSKLIIDFKIFVEEKNIPKQEDQSVKWREVSCPNSNSCRSTF